MHAYNVALQIGVRIARPFTDFLTDWRIRLKRNRLGCCGTEGGKRDACAPVSYNVRQKDDCTFLY